MGAVLMPASPNGLLVLDKPPGISSRAAVDQALRWFPRGTRLGHTGTLDPLATGVLVLCVGSATRLGEYVQGMTKVYRAGLLLGARSDTDDADGVHTISAVDRPPTREQILDAMPTFLGEIDQVPPAYSAAKVTGRRAYALARKGHAVSLQPRKVRVKRIDLLAFDYPRLDLEIECGKGTYIRSLARDLGDRLGCGALVQSLRRLRVGPFTADEAVPPQADRETALAKMRPVAEAVAGLPAVSLSDADAKRFALGQAIPWRTPAETEVAVFDPKKELLAVARWDAGRRELRPVKVLSQKEGP
jgi:tRNA pseudouridine55 synthase